MRFGLHARLGFALPPLGLIALAAWGCGASDAANGGGGSAGVAHAGSSSAGSAQGGSAAAGGPHAGGMSGASGTHDLGVGGLYETCLVCGGAFGFGGRAGSGGSGGASGSSGVAGSTAGAGGARSGVSCGDVTCSPNQYCRAACNGVGFGGAQSTPGKPSCQGLPVGCDGVPSCACICGTGNTFCTGTSQVQCGCG